MYFWGYVLFGNKHWKHNKSFGNKNHSVETLICNRNFTSSGNSKIRLETKNVALEHSFDIGSIMILWFQSHFIVSKLHFLFRISFECFQYTYFVSNRLCIFPIDFYASNQPCFQYMSPKFGVQTTYNQGEGSNIFYKHFKRR